MKPGFILNCHDRNENPLFESHDPSMMYDPVSGMCYSYSTDSAITSQYKQGIPVRKSRDMVNFEFVGYALSEKAIAEGRDNGEYPPTPGFWAPYVEYCGGEYRMYYSATKAFGSSESKIWLAVSKDPEGTFENRGIVMNTWGTDNTYPNAIDAHVVDDFSGNKYLIYGSFFGGIFIKELDRTTGLAKSNDAFELGKCIAKRPKGAHVDGPEGAAVIRNDETGYFYLFLSYGWLADTYDIRVGRSKNVMGPYLDMAGKDMFEETLGTKVAGSYFFSADKPYAKAGNWTFAGFRGPGHGVPFYHEEMKRYFFVHHMRDGAPEHVYLAKNAGEQTSFRMHYMIVRAMYFVKGWPVFCPEPFAGEDAAKEIVCDIVGGVPTGCDANDTYEWVKLTYDNNDIVKAKKDIDARGCFGVMGKCFDYENSTECVMISVYDNDGNTLWGKKHVH